MNLCNTDTPQGLDGFGARLKIIRGIKNLTQQEVAEKSGLVAAHVSHFETGERLPSLENLRVLCKALNVSADYLIDSDECVTTKIDEEKIEEMTVTMAGVEVAARILRSAGHELAAQRCEDLISALINERNPNHEGSLAFFLAESNEREKETEAQFQKAKEWNALCELELKNMRTIVDENQEDSDRLETLQRYGFKYYIYAMPDGKWSIREKSGERFVFLTIQECADALINISANDTDGMRPPRRA